MIPTLQHSEKGKTTTFWRQKDQWLSGVYEDVEMNV